MQQRTGVAIGLLLFVSCHFRLTAQQTSPAFAFGGKRLYVGMSESEAVESLTACCKLSPPVTSQNQETNLPAGEMAGHFIVSKNEQTPTILGTVFFSGGKVVMVTRPLDNEVDTSNDDLVTFAKALKRTLASEAADSSATALVSLKHESMNNGDSDTICVVFPNGHGIQLRVGTIDKAGATNKRDFATLDEILETKR
jgi:hypothetical protein